MKQADITEEVALYYKTHTRVETIEKFQISPNAMNIIAKKYPKIDKLSFEQKEEIFLRFRKYGKSEVKDVTDWMLRIIIGEFKDIKYIPNKLRELGVPKDDVDIYEYNMSDMSREDIASLYNTTLYHIKKTIIRCNKIFNSSILL